MYCDVRIRSHEEHGAFSKMVATYDSVLGRTNLGSSVIGSPLSGNDKITLRLRHRPSTRIIFILTPNFRNNSITL